MIATDKKKMLHFIEKYKNDVEYRTYVNSVGIENLSEIEQIALKGLIVSNEGVEILNADFSNCYDSYNPVDISTPEALQITCMNMAIAELLFSAFQENNINKYSDFNLSDIKMRVKGDMFSRLDKPTVIEFIKSYHNAYPEFLPKKAQDFWKMYHGHIRNGVGTAMFVDLAHTFNTNIYLSELYQEETKDFFIRKKKTKD